MKKRKAKRGYTGPTVVDTETFIMKARWQHGNRYDYSNVRYKRAHDKVEIICRDHGVFTVTPKNHAVAASGCPACKVEITRSLFTKSFDDFVKMSRDIHGEKYDYSEVEYSNRKTPVKIICKIHGEFYQKPADHINSGAGCQKCSGMNHVRSNTETFVEKAKIVHGDKYDYSKVDYVDATTKVRIICKLHGEFLQAPYHHLSDRGCVKCSLISRSEINRHSKEEFIEKSKEIHGDKYDYSKVIYKSSKEPVKIICPEHGEFLKIPNSHTSQQSGCPDCSLRDRGWGASGFYGTDSISNLYVFRIYNQDCEFIKVGLSKEVHRRMSQINKETGCSVEKLYSLEGKANKLFELEQKIIYYSGLQKYKHPEPFSGHTELFNAWDFKNIVSIAEKHKHKVRQ